MPTTNQADFAAEERDEVSNDDMHIPAARLAGVGEQVKTAAGEAQIAAAFDRFEAKAVHAKRLHDRLGILSLVSLILALESALFRVAAPNVAPEWLVQLMLLTGLVPVGVGVFLRLSDVHAHWILSRYRAERVRHWKFQQFMDGEHMQALPPAFAPAWQIFMDDLDGWGRLRTFVSNDAFPRLFTERPYTDSAVFVQAMGIYKVFRLDLQRNWYNQVKRRYIVMDQQSEALAKALLGAGALMAFGETVLHWMSEAHLGHILSISGVGVALLSAGIRVYRSASGVSESAERYQHIADQLSRLEVSFSDRLTAAVADPAQQPAVLETVHEIERVCHLELVEFLRVSQKSDYFI